MPQLRSSTNKDMNKLQHELCAPISGNWCRLVKLQTHKNHAGRLPQTNNILPAQHTAGTGGRAVYEEGDERGTYMAHPSKGVGYISDLVFPIRIMPSVLISFFSLSFAHSSVVSSRVEGRSHSLMAARDSPSSSNIYSVWTFSLSHR